MLMHVAVLSMQSGFIVLPALLRERILGMRLSHSLLLSCSATVSFYLAGILMGEPEPPFPRWGLETPYLLLGLLAFLLSLLVLLPAVRQAASRVEAGAWSTRLLALLVYPLSFLCWYGLAIGCYWLLF